ncbi:acyl-CoA dehydrogenase family protein [Streptomyces sp. NPDC005322]|uniref:acyl-CoA dehydrogenase family protein n=1 Tax=Streptomyces sp. NPDC005322 TaxID=3157032 RepID=UPI0033BF1BAA
MHFDWSAEQQAAYEAMLAAVREEFPGPVRDGPFSRKDWLVLGGLGLLGLSVPAEYGGGGLGALDTAHRVEAFGRGCPDTGIVFAASAHLFACAMPLVGFAGAAAKKRFLPGMASGELVAGNAMTEEEAGSDVSRLATTATEVPGGFILNGTKSFVSNGPEADVFITYATTDPSLGHLGITGFVVARESEGLYVGGPHAKMGLRSVPAGPVTFEDCFVPEEQVLGVPGQGGAIFQHSMSWERACLFAGYVGLLDRVLEQSVEHARSRKQFGAPIGTYQSVSNRVADMKLRLEGARLLMYSACWQMDQGRPSPIGTALSKLAVSQAAVANALDAVAVFGGRGYLRECGVESVLRDSVPTTIFSGTSDIQRLVIAKELGL